MLHGRRATIGTRDYLSLSTKVKSLKCYQRIYWKKKISFQTIKSTIIIVIDYILYLLQVCIFNSNSFCISISEF